MSEVTSTTAAPATELYEAYNPAEEIEVAENQEQVEEISPEEAKKKADALAKKLLAEQVAEEGSAQETTASVEA